MPAVLGGFKPFKMLNILLENISESLKSKSLNLMLS